MFEIGSGEDGVIYFKGRLDTAQADKAREFVESSAEASVFDFAELEYISSAGLGVLLVAHKRLMRSGGALKLINVNNHIHDVFQYSGFVKLFQIERSGS
ncbi:MAG: STAS domain-containing protein [Halieaceae bacterium]